MIAETELDKAFNRFQINFPYTRLMRHSDSMVYSSKGGDLDYVVRRANVLILDLGLDNLVAERNNKSAVLFNTILIKAKK